MSVIDGIYKVKLNDKMYKARLDFGAILLSMEHYKKFDKNITYPEVFESILSSTDNNRIIISLVMLETIKRCNEDIDNIIWEDIKATEFDIIKAQLIFLISKSLPENKESSVKNKLPSRSKIKNDWDIDEMEFQWSSILKRVDDFYCITPIKFFKQIDAYGRFNEVSDKKDNIKEEVVGSTMSI